MTDLDTRAPRKLDRATLGPTLVEERVRARHLPGWIYTAEEVFAREAERIFLRQWLVVGRVEELERPGDYLTIDVVGEPVVVARDLEGALSAFSNVCRHRGARVVGGRGNARLFSCPYHGWVYDLSGRLQRTTAMEDVEEFDFASCRLPRVSVDTWAGWIFVNLAADAAPLAQHVEEFAARLGHFRQQDCRLSNTLVIEAPVNWKLIVENFIDVYHFRFVHAGSFGRQGNPALTLPYDSGDTIVFRPGGRPLTPTGESLFGPMPWLKEDDASAAGLMLPNAYFTFHHDNVQLWMTHPLGVARSRIVIYTLFPAAHFARADFAERSAVYHRFVEQILREDIDMVTHLQQSLSSRHFRPGPIGSLETGVHTAIHRLLEPILEA
ncbi:MAG: aromatic ring-hydroxylating dioxygenase subunit alpha [Alphaproteobacteria bacterium]|nr:aromatic ring-hydroxylating dioxygenase subunit alpha [Alphaproteobacteria bacterium]